MTLHRLDKLVAVDRGFVHVAHVEHRLQGDHLSVTNEGAFFRGESECASGPTLGEMSDQLLHGGLFEHQRLVPAGRPGDTIESSLRHLQVGEHQLGVDDLDVAQRVDGFVDVGDIGVLEAAHDVQDGVDAADVPEELVAEPLALRRPSHQAGDVDDLDGRGDDLLRGDDASSSSRRGSGTGTMPTLGSMVQNG